MLKNTRHQISTDRNRESASREPAESGWSFADRKSVTVLPEDTVEKT